MSKNFITGAEYKKRSIIERSNNAFEAQRQIHAGLREQARSRRATATAAIDVYVIGEVRPSMAAMIGIDLERAPNAKTVNVHIDSNGGECDAMMDICASLRGHGGRKIVWIAKRCASAALVIAACGDERICRPNSCFLHHSAHSGGNLNDWNTLSNAVIARTGIASPVASWLCDRGNADIPFGSSVAQAAGLVTKIEDFCPQRMPPAERMRLYQADRVHPVMKKRRAEAQKNREEWEAFAAEVAASVKRFREILARPKRNDWREEGFKREKQNAADLIAWGQEILAARAA
jgi:ATP-dependent protease ClpP protease subunit